MTRILVIVFLIVCSVPFPAYAQVCSMGRCVDASVLRPTHPVRRHAELGSERTRPLWAGVAGGISLLVVSYLANTGVAGFGWATEVSGGHLLDASYLGLAFLPFAGPFINASQIHGGLIAGHIACGVGQVLGLVITIASTATRQPVDRVLTADGFRLSF